MKSVLQSFLLFSFILLLSSSSFATLQSTRWTLNDDRNSDLTSVLNLANQKLGTSVQESDLVLFEEQDLGVWKFQMWNQTIQSLPVKGGSLRIWKNLADNQLVQAEIQFENPLHQQTASLIRNSKNFSRQSFSRQELAALTKDLGLSRFRNYKTQDIWHPKHGPVRSIQIFAESYSWEILQSLVTKRTISKVRKDYPRSDITRRADEFEMPALVYLTPEEHEEARTQTGVARQNVTLKYLKRSAPIPSQNIFTEFMGQIFAESKNDEAKGQTEAGRNEGFWSMAYLKQRISDLMASIPLVNNAIADGSTYLVGRFVSVQIHPDARAKFQPAYPATFGANASFNWMELPDVNGQPDWGMNIGPTHLGAPARDFWDFYNRPAPWRVEANTTDLMNEGFDEVQVYWAVNQWFETLHDLGFQDPQISTRPITAILFNPDIESRDNAFYTDDSINFTTYSTGAANYARDTATIWHELGHGLEDRILRRADYDGGLSEGLADLTADMMLNAVTQGKNYPGKEARRIVNQLGFNLTNEEHDAGEAYGGTLRELSEQIIQAEGMMGFRKFADLIFDSMRLSRNNPSLDVQEWFRHMLFADELGKTGVRQPGEFASRLHSVLQERNFSFDTADTASFPVLVEGFETLTDRSPGSRYRPIPLDLLENETKQFILKVQILDGAKTKLKYPVTIRASYRGGPLQGSSRFQNEDQVQEWTVQKSGDEINVPVTVLAGCDQINRVDQRCSDFAYLKLYNAGQSKPFGKKRFYVNVKALTR